MSVITSKSKVLPHPTVAELDLAIFMDIMPRHRANQSRCPNNSALHHHQKQRISDLVRLGQNLISVRKRWWIVEMADVSILKIVT